MADAGTSSQAPYSSEGLGFPKRFATSANGAPSSTPTGVPQPSDFTGRGSQLNHGGGVSSAEVLKDGGSQTSPRTLKKFFSQILNEERKEGELQLKAPGLHRGMPAIYFTNEEIELLAQPYKYAMVGKFSKRSPDFKLIKPALLKLGFRGGFTVGALKPGYVLINFEFEEDFTRLWVKPEWQIAGWPMILFKWSPNFNYQTESSMAAVWVTFPDLPLHFFNKSALFSIAQLIGKPVKVDEQTADLSRPSSARVCVEIDLMKEYGSDLWIRCGSGGWLQQNFIFENMPSYCRTCLKRGHSDEHCKHAFQAEKGKDKETDEARIAKALDKISKKLQAQRREGDTSLGTAAQDQGLTRTTQGPQTPTEEPNNQEIQPNTRLALLQKGRKDDGLTLEGEKQHQEIYSDIAENRRQRKLADAKMRTMQHLEAPGETRTAAADPMIANNGKKQRSNKAVCLIADTTSSGAHISTLLPSNILNQILETPISTIAEDIPFWRLLQHWLLVDFRLQKKGFQLASNCQCCQNIESFQHVFFSSNITQEVWQYFSSWFKISLPYMDSAAAMFQYWYYKSHSAIPGHICCIMPILILWFIWEARNDSKHRHLEVSDRRIIYEISSHLRLLQKSNLFSAKQWAGYHTLASNLGLSLKPASNRLPVKVIWKKPEPGVVKLNVDGSSKGNPGRAAIGGILRDNLGQVILAFYEPIGNQSNTYAELQALLKGLEICKTHGYHKVWIESDSQVIIHMILAKSKGSLNLQPIVTKIKVLLDDFSFSISHIFREGNRPADWLANLKDDDPIYFFENSGLPKALRRLVSWDCLEYPNFRF